MGDQELDNYLNGKEGDDDDDVSEIPFCQKNLIFNVIKQKMDHTRDLLNIFSKLNSMEDISPSGNKKYDEHINYLFDESKGATLQLDYIMALIMDEINSECEEEEGDDDDDTL